MAVADYYLMKDPMKSQAQDDHAAALESDTGPSYGGRGVGVGTEGETLQPGAPMPSADKAFAQTRSGDIGKDAAAAAAFLIPFGDRLLESAQTVAGVSTGGPAQSQAAGKAGAAARGVSKDLAALKAAESGARAAEYEAGKQQRRALPTDQDLISSTFDEDYFNRGPYAKRRVEGVQERGPEHHDQRTRQSVRQLRAEGYVPQADPLDLSPRTETGIANRERILGLRPPRIQTWPYSAVPHEDMPGWMKSRYGPPPDRWSAPKSKVSTTRAVGYDTDPNVHAVPADKYAPTKEKLAGHVAAQESSITRALDNMRKYLNNSEIASDLAKGAKTTVKVVSPAMDVLGAVAGAFAVPAAFFSEFSKSGQLPEQLKFMAHVGHNRPLEAGDIAPGVLDILHADTAMTEQLRREGTISEALYQDLK